MILRNYNRVLIVCTLLILFASCNRQTTIDSILFKETKNKIYKDLEEAKLSEAINNILKEESNTLKNEKFLKAFYEQNSYKAQMLIKFFPKEKLKLLADHLDQVSDHGLNPDYFHADDYKKMLALVSAKDGISNIEEAYKHVAMLEVATADALLNYSSALEFGVVNPNKILKRYYIETQQADSNFFSSILSAADLDNLLDSIQPKSATYLALQNALKAGVVEKDRAPEETVKTLKVNLERERWNQEIDTSKLVYVNIPAFRLDVVSDGKPTMSMKVVVGTGRNNDRKTSFPDVNKPIKDAPHAHETPILASRIHSVQVNPVWNIPESIAGKEILKHVQSDRYYLANSGIDVLQDGKVIEDSENIDWSAFSPDNLPYRFRQRPGDDNALGKIKFLFKNNSSVYLHDTPAQAAFNREIRASSHGCVRVAEPLDLAKALFESDKFNMIKKDMESSEQKDAKDITLPAKTQVVLDYKTVEVRDNKLQFHPDVYGQDIVLYSYM